MKGVAIIVLSALVFSAVCASGASAQSPHKATLTPFSPVLTPFSAAMNFMSKAGYVRYVNLLQTGRWKGSAL
jgi:hypothetical protein